MSKNTLSGVIAAIATAIDDQGAPDATRSVKLARYLLDNGCDGLNVLGTTGEATSFSLAQRMGLMSAYRAGGPAARSDDGRHRGRRARRRARADAPCRGTRVRRRAGAAALLLQGCPRRRAVRRDQGARGRHTRPADPDLSLPFPRQFRHPMVDCADPATARRIPRPRRGPEGFVRRHGLRARGRSGGSRLRGLPLHRGGADRGARRRVRRMHFGDRQSQRRSVRTRLARRRHGRARCCRDDPQAVRRQAAGLRRQGDACTPPWRSRAGRGWRRRWRRTRPPTARSPSPDTRGYGPSAWRDLPRRKR